MSTAGRPTYSAATGKRSGLALPTSHSSGKDQIAHTKLKFRQPGQGIGDEVQQRDFRAELEKKEWQHTMAKSKDTAWLAKEEQKVDVPLLLKNQPEIDTEKIKKYDDSDVEVEDSDEDSDFDSSGDEHQNKKKKPNNDSDDDDKDSDDEDDEERELQRELERIREERAIAQAKRLQDEKDLEEKLRKDSSVKSNPLMMQDSSSAKMKRRWNDDVVFRNQAKDEPETKKRFINDTIRSDFHRSFLKKFIK